MLEKLLRILHSMIHCLDYNYKNLGDDRDAVMTLFNKYRRKYYRKADSKFSEKDIPEVCKVIDSMIPLVERNYDRFDNVNKADVLADIEEYRKLFSLAEVKK